MGPPLRPLSRLWLTSLSLTIILMPMEDTMDVASARLAPPSFTPVQPHLESSPHTCLSMEPKWPPLPLPMVFTLLVSTSKLPPSRLLLLSSLPDQLSLDLCLMLMLCPHLRAPLDPL